MTAPHHIHLDAVGGIAGDMFVAALLDAFPGLHKRVMGDVSAVIPPESGRASLTEGTSGGIRALRFGLVSADQREIASAHRHDHGAAPDGPHHALPAWEPAASAAHVDEMVAPAPGRKYTVGPADGSFRALVAGIRSATLAPGTADAAIAMLTHLARAEARVHGVPMEQVHFHEIGGWDSLMDVVGAGSIAAALPAVVWSVSDLPLGGGQVDTRHGRLPVPTPATSELLTGFRWCDDGVGGERVTPTGATILRHLVATTGAPVPRIGGRLIASGNGAGTRELTGMPNVLRALVFDSEETGNAGRVAVISFEVDDMTGEEIGVAADRLRVEPGVLDVSLTTRIGKKSRPLLSFRLLADPIALASVQARCFAETSTIGLRWHMEERTTLSRASTLTMTAAGSAVRIKNVVRPEGDTIRKAESDDLRGLPGLQARRALKAQAEYGDDEP